MFAPNLHRFDAIAGLKNAMALVGEEATHQFKHGWLVFKQEDRRFLAFAFARLAARAVVGGNENPERRAAAFFADHFDPAVVLFDDSVNCRQTEASPLSGRFCCEEWFE